MSPRGDGVSLTQNISNLQARRDEAKAKLRQEMAIYRAAQRAYDNELQDWNESDKQNRGKRPRYTGPEEPTYDGPEEWELTNAREQARMQQFHLQSNPERFRKREIDHKHTINTNTSIVRLFTRSV